MAAVKTLAGELLAQAQLEMKSRWNAKLRQFEAMENGPEKAALAVELFGRWSNKAKAAQKAGRFMTRSALRKRLSQFRHGRCWGFWRLSRRYWTLDYVYDPYKYVDLLSIAESATPMWEMQDWIAHWHRKPGFADEWSLAEALTEIFGDQPGFDRKVELIKTF